MGFALQMKYGIPGIQRKRERESQKINKLGHYHSGLRRMTENIIVGYCSAALIGVRGDSEEEVEGNLAVHN